MNKNIIQISYEGLDRFSLNDLENKLGVWVTYRPYLTEFNLLTPPGELSSPILGLSNINDDHRKFAIKKNYELILDEAELANIEGAFADIGAIYFPKNYLQTNNPIPVSYADALALARFGSPCTLKRAETSNGCLFLDRDGIIIDDRGYINDPDECELFEGIVPIINWAREKGWKVICLTNQAGIGRGLISHEQFRQVTNKVDYFLSQHNCQLDEWFYCPYHPEAGQGEYLKTSMSRKPYPGMLLKALSKHEISIDNAVYIGDKESDILLFPWIKYYLLKGKYPVDQNKFKDIFHFNHSEILSSLKRDFN